MHAKVLARLGAAGLAGLAVVLALVQLTAKPTPGSGPVASDPAPGTDGLPEALEACARMGEAALADPACQGAWAESRRRFFGAGHPHATSAVGSDSGQQGPARDTPCTGGGD